MFAFYVLFGFFVFVCIAVLSEQKEIEPSDFIKKIQLFLVWLSVDCLIISFWFLFLFRFSHTQHRNCLANANRKKKHENRFCFFFPHKIWMRITTFHIRFLHIYISYTIFQIKHEFYFWFQWPNRFFFYIFFHRSINFSNDMQLFYLLIKLMVLNFADP